MPTEPFEIEGGRIELAIADLERRFNLNAVTGAENLQRLKRLMVQLELDPNLADAWLDWIDHDETVYGFGAEDEDYLLLEPAYRAANQSAVSTSTMLAVEGFTKSVQQRLLPHVALLPGDELQGKRQHERCAKSCGAWAILSQWKKPRRWMELPREFPDVAEAIKQYAGCRPARKR